MAKRYVQDDADPCCRQEFHMDKHRFILSTQQLSLNFAAHSCKAHGRYTIMSLCNTLQGAGHTSVCTLIEFSANTQADLATTDARPVRYRHLHGFI